MVTIRKPPSANDAVFSGPPLRTFRPLDEGALTSIVLSASRQLGGLVRDGKRSYESGSDPNQAYAEFNVEKLTELLIIDRRTASRVLSAYKDSDGEGKLMASAFVASAIVCITFTDPSLARHILAEILHEARKDPLFQDLAKMVLLTVMRLAKDIPEGMEDQALVSLGESCASQFARLSGKDRS